MRARVNQIQGMLPQGELARMPDFIAHYRKTAKVLKTMGDAVVERALDALLADLKKGLGGMGPEFAAYMSRLLGTEKEEFDYPEWFAESAMGDRISDLGIAGKLPMYSRLLELQEGGRFNNCAFEKSKPAN